MLLSMILVLLSLQVCYTLAPPMTTTISRWLLLNKHIALMVGVAEQNMHFWNHSTQQACLVWSLVNEFAFKTSLRSNYTLLFLSTMNVHVTTCLWVFLSCWIVHLMRFEKLTQATFVSMDICSQSAMLMLTMWMYLYFCITIVNMAISEFA